MKIINNNILKEGEKITSAFCDSFSLETQPERFVKISIFLFSWVFLGDVSLKLVEFAVRTWQVF